MSVEEITISELILSGTQVIEETDAVPLGEIIHIRKIRASCPDSSNATARIEFGSSILWVIQRSESIILEIKLVGNGTDKLKLICDNSCSGDYYFNAEMIFARS